MNAPMKPAKLADHIRKVVDAAPPLTHEQRERLRSLLASGLHRRVAADLLPRDRPNAAAICGHTWGVCAEQNGSSHFCQRAAPCFSHRCTFCSASG